MASRSGTMLAWRNGSATPCQGEGRGFDSRRERVPFKDPGKQQGVCCVVKGR